MFNKTLVLLWYLVGSCIAKMIEIRETIDWVSMKGLMEIESFSNVVKVK
jgi:hypothetical protein